MAEYIDKQALNEYINKRINNSAIRGWIKSIINKIPTADVVEVVRCKDCKYLMFSDFYGECSQGHMGIVYPTDYCSRGKRKEENK